MAKFNITYFERVNNYWSDIIEAETEEEAANIFFAQIQGEEPNSSDTIDTELEIS
jgi:hypothetical protein